MNQVPFHDGAEDAGKLFYWHGSDNMQVYQNNIQDKKKLFYLYDKQWYDETSIVYQLNNYGFRGDDFGTDPCVITLGCSYTFGTGLPEKDTWPRHLANATGLKLANLGWPGSSADTAYRFLRYWINQLNVKLVCFLLPPAARFDLFFDLAFRPKGHTTPVVTYMPRYLADTWDSNDSTLNNWFGNEENAILNQEKNTIYIR